MSLMAERMRSNRLDGRNDRAGLDRSFEPHEFRPLAEYRRRFDGVADQRLSPRFLA
jgi:hypothetical protein